MTTRAKAGIFKPQQKLNLTASTLSPIPSNPSLALHDPNWKSAMTDEYNALIENKTWVLVPRPSDANILRRWWIFMHKLNADGSFERHKARLVGNGANQLVGVDCGETFSLVVKPATI
ncbi:Reverse transcriptase (RNA-dependent DNA polymerase) [Euphorbia peplus]|nr:Reverse transcriptase (RNA-dependent DNA polymerase) [Euphorbia peplus]